MANRSPYCQRGAVKLPVALSASAPPREAIFETLWADPTREFDFQLDKEPA